MKERVKTIRHRVAVIGRSPDYDSSNGADIARNPECALNFQLVPLVAKDIVAVLLWFRRKHNPDQGTLVPFRA